MLRLFLIFLVLVSFKGNTSPFAKKLRENEQAQQAPPKPSLDGIQEKIYQAFVHSMNARDKEELMKLSHQLIALDATEDPPIIIYWRAYLQFYISVFHLKNGDEEKAEREIDKGIDWMEDLERRNSEDNALLAMMQGFSIQFKSLKVIFLAMDIKSNLKQALEQDSTNQRAYYVYASNDYYTPEKYGGGKSAEQYLLKAISLADQTSEKPYLPSWGKEESYELLIKLYIKAEKYDLAKKYYKEGLANYPDSYFISQLSSKLPTIN
ncbi:hypothetical protein GCM10007049_23600 [Echinicola pacifica]|uniref:Tetratricopeptide repeat protein n=1 Tax=Echinicola pacifica TaxID=346377 RepID=A0A918US93_9BACT|nr:hypothetical protein [Echinicola pacifica]GGZ29642.1 hypothetical protein GCM10007049_23600 [Echinicola pacifica]